MNTTTTISWPRWDKNTNSTITWFIQPPEEYKVPIVNQYIKLTEEYDNMFYQTNTVQEGGFDKCEKYIVAFFKGFSKENLENKEKSITMTLSENKINVTCSFKSIKCTDNQFVCVSENLQTSMARICEVTDTNELDYIPRSNDSKFGLEVFERNITHNFNPEEMFIPNKAMQYIASEKGSGISMPGLIRFIITDGQDQRFRLEKSAGYVPSYSLFFVIDCAESSSGMLSIKSIKSTVLTVFSQ
ncbi:nuclear chaperone required for maturation and nuclear export of pre-60s ribosome subunits [Trichomonas vaginalis G3]|uniref:nuclear chaperone required for maturation and nuclear export of pre-60s ribosome subunits n=1 Tax=Trichomonas vaginalis (strain ATCC PRA-98 / G3) TaxID=412133 RepID=UPI0021E5E5FD|nr:nuclear chaperone required for maturation and nuclear export of pre-60s ribosome subunits [Trichomonas vaginalis G3]KAI5524963.1 nuclear chaperone required for maturation and nuclear export of pre-60s ribosome subunits [Trichomonas vaginalis G3]